MADSVAMAVVVTATWGFLNVIMNGSINQTIQTAVQDDLRGRIMGQHLAVFDGGPAVGGLLAGIATSAFGIVLTMAIGGAFATAAAVGVLLRLRREPAVRPTDAYPSTRP